MECSFTTGYLTQTGRKDTNTFMFTIPNMEIRNIFLTQIMEYFKKTVSENGEALEKFCNALKMEIRSGRTKFEQLSEKDHQYSGYLCKKQMKENFYHGFYLEFLDFSRTGVCHQIKNRVMDTVIF